MIKIILVGVVINLLLVKIFPNLNQFHAFYIWLAVFLASNLYVLSKLFSDLKIKFFDYFRKYGKGLLFAFFLAFIPRIMLLGIYPHISIFDELRDAGLLAQKLMFDNSTPIFGFGSYEGYGNFVPLSSYFAMKILGASFLSYTVPAMIYGTLAICLLYLVLAPIKGVSFALITVAFCSVVLSNLQFSRTEICIISDSFISMLLLVAFLFSQKHLYGYFFFGLMSGLTWHFYAGSRLILLCFLFIIGFEELKKSLSFYSKKHLLLGIKRVLLILLYIFSGLFISLGPTVLYLKLSTVFSGSGVRLMIFNQASFIKLDLWEKITKIFSLYQEAFSTYTIKPVHYYYFNYYPYALLNFPVNILFAVGIIMTFIKKNDYIQKVALLIVLLFPFLSQVLVNQIGYIHRMQGVVVFANIMATIGLFFVYGKLKKRFKLSNVMMFCFVGIVYFSQLYIFFVSRLVDVPYEKRSPEAYVYQEVLKDIAVEPVGSHYYILNTKPFDISPLHYKEKATYMTRPRDVQIISLDLFKSKIFNVIKNKTKGRYVFVTLSRQGNLIGGNSATTKFHESQYICNMRYFGQLYDCPKGMSGYSYYYLVIENK